MANLDDVLGTNWEPTREVILPLGISFFTFQQIAYLVDAYRGETQEYSALKYGVFVSFFPQLIAGPIVHHKQIVFQLYDKAIYRFNWEKFAIGITIFIAGLFKKVIFADNLARYATPVFQDAARDMQVQFFQAWGGALAYSLQLYYDFSGYSDMAIGAAFMFGITLPINFNSPYKATSIIDFWRRWHITLSNFLRDYLYIPLGGNRKGEIRRYINLMVTMLLGGLWHGAGWTFVLWGGLHGVYLIINNQWRSLCKKLGRARQGNHGWSRAIGTFITLVAVVIAWVFFRASNLDAALVLLRGMMGENGVSIPLAIAEELGFLKPLLESWGVKFTSVAEKQFVFTYVWSLTLFAIALFCPNLYQWMREYNPIQSKDVILRHSEEDSSLKHLKWQPNSTFGILMGISAFIVVKTFFTVSQSEFLYFNF